MIKRWRIPIVFSSWVARIGTPADRITALRTFWAGAPAEVRENFKLQPDLSFEIGVGMIQAQITNP
jgi:hypothetical protein